MIHVTIDEKNIEVPQGTTVLRAAEMAGIEIPTLCDHPALKPYGGCRLCVVEVEGFRTLQASCTLPVMNGMVIHTNSPKVRKSREFVLTLLFSERNHFCMYCQKSGGDCELQNAAYGQNMTHWPIQPNWKPYPVDASCPYFAIDHNRCILCRRCVRACGDLVGNFTLGMENRGASTMLVSDYGLPQGQSSCVKCGTCVQVCPTGALIDKHSAYLGLDKKVEHINSVCVGCSVGCSTELVVRDNQLIRIDGNWEAPLNAGVLCQQGRYEMLDEIRQLRITTPLVRKDGQLEPASWDEAYATLAERLGAAAKKNGSGIAAITTTRLSSEDLFAFKELFAGQMQAALVSTVEEDLTAASLPGESSLETLKAADCVFVIGADLVKSHQVAGFFVKRNLPKGTTLIVVDPAENQMEPFAAYALHPAKGKDYELLMGLVYSVINLGLEEAPAPIGLDLAQFAPTTISKTTGISAEKILAVARELGTAHKLVIVYGKGLAHSAQALEALALLAKVVGAEATINPKGKANSVAAQRYQLDKAFEPLGYEAVYVAMGDDYPAKRLVEKLANTPFVAVQAAYVSPLTERADVVLPTTIWAEQEGHYVNLEGNLQASVRALKAPAGVLTNQEILKSLASRMGYKLDCDWQTALEAVAN